MIDYSSMRFPKPVTEKKFKKPIRKVGKIAKARISKHGTETQLHDRVWAKQHHYCEMCGAYIHDSDRRAWCFAHRLSKGMYKQYRYMEENIALVCSEKCHHELDKKYQGKTLGVVNRRNQLIIKLDGILGIEHPTGSQITAIIIDEA